MYTVTLEPGQDYYHESLCVIHKSLEGLRKKILKNFSAIFQATSSFAAVEEEH